MLNSIALFSQIEFQKGYIVDNNKKIECLIQNDNWANAPKTISYKMTVNSPIITRDVDEIQELYIYNTDQNYLLVRVQRLLNKEDTITEKRFLKCLLSGEASLFTYKNNGVEQFFFKVNDSRVMRLVYSKLIVDGKILTNSKFRQQLSFWLKCNSVTEKRIIETGYNKQSLINILKDYNSCKGTDYTDFNKYKRKGKLYLSVLGGGSLFRFENKDHGLDSNDVGSRSSKNSLKLGVDAELRIPFNRNKWGLFSELNYSKYTSKGSALLTMVSTAPSNIGVESRVNFSFTTDISMLEIPIGIRYYSFINKENILFYNAAFSYNILLPNKEHIKYDSGWNKIMAKESVFKANYGWNLGVGYQYNSKYGIEIRFTQMGILKIKTLSLNSNSISFLVSYKI
ncbi:MAG: outer membrane beta-barrel protein [Prolixibacteraceae bacterium]|jgi:hypothetical protein